MRKATNMLVAVCLGALGVGVLARTAAPEPQESSAAPKLVPVTKELWEDERTHRIRFAVVVPPVEGVSEKATAGVELLCSPVNPRQYRDPFRESRVELLQYQKKMIEFELMVEEELRKPDGKRSFRPPVGTGPTIMEVFQKALNESDLVEKVERDLPGGKKTTVCVPKKGREKEQAELMFRVAREHLRSPKNTPDREETIEAETNAAVGIVCQPRYQHHASQGWSYVVEAYLNDKGGDFVSGLNHFLASRDVKNWSVQQQAAPAWEKVASFIDEACPVVLLLREPLENRRYVTVVGTVPAERSLIVSLPSSEGLHAEGRAVAPWGTQRVAWDDVAGRIEAAFVVVQSENDEAREGKENTK